MRGGWKGVVWPPVVKGRCTVHNERVGDVTRLCFSCHREQLAAAGVSSVPETTSPSPREQQLRVDRAAVVREAREALGW